MMKKAAALLLSAVCIFVLAGCSLLGPYTETDYPAAIMVEGNIYLKSAAAMPAEVDESADIGYTTSYTDTYPEKDGETNFNRELGMPYARVREGIAVLCGNEWFLCRPRQTSETDTAETEQIYTLQQAETMHVELAEWGVNYFKGIVADAGDNIVFPSGSELSVVFDYDTEILLDDGTVMMFSPDEPDTGIIGWKEGTVVAVRFVNYDEYREENHFHNQVYASYAAAENNRTSQETETVVLKAPPVLTVSSGQNNSVEALLGTYWWTVQEDDMAMDIDAEGMHPLDAKEDMPPLYLIPSPASFIDPFKACLQWDPFPDRISMRCWEDECWGRPDAESESVPVEVLETETADGSYSIGYFAELKDGNYIYEIEAEWNRAEKYSGTACYSFYTIKPAMTNDGILNAGTVSEEPKQK